MYKKFLPGDYSVWEPHDSISNSNVNSYYTDDSDYIVKVGVARIFNFYKISIYKLISIIILLISFIVTINNFFIPIVASNFFTNKSLIINLLYIYGFQFIWLLGKPLGMLLFAFLAFNRNPFFALNIAIIIFIFSLFLLGILPSSNNIGFLAPFFFIFLKILETGSSSAIKFISKNYLIDHFKENHISKVKSINFYNIFSVVGSILATIICMLSIQDLQNQGYIYIWRSIYIFISFLVLILFFMLNNSNYKKNILLKKSIKFTNSKFCNNVAFIDFCNNFFIEIFNYKYIILKISLVMCFTNMTYFLVFNFLHVFIPIISKININNMYKLTFYLLMLDFLVLLIFNKILIKQSSKKLLLLSSVILTITILPMFLLLNQGSLGWLILITSWIVFWGVMFSCRASIWSYDMVSNLPKKYIVLALGSILGGDLIGKNTAAICCYLWYFNKNLLAPAVYLTILFGLTALIIFFSNNLSGSHRIKDHKERKNRYLDLISY